MDQARPRCNNATLLLHCDRIRAKRAFSQATGSSGHRRRPRRAREAAKIPASSSRRANKWSPGRLIESTRNQFFPAIMIQRERARAGRSRDLEVEAFAYPAICNFTSYWSDQNQGVATNGFSRPIRAAAAALPCSTAFWTLSSRRKRPSPRRQTVQSPAATIDGGGPGAGVDNDSPVAV